MSQSNNIKTCTLSARHKMMFSALEKYIRSSRGGGNLKVASKVRVNEIVEGRISFAYEDLTGFPIEAAKLLSDITHLDLSGNRISNFEFLRGFIHLKSLIVDGNISIGNSEARSTFPPIPNLELFYSNNCQISFPADFLFKISSLFVNIKYLSLMDYASSKIDEKRQHRLRMFAILMNPFLVHLNEKAVSDIERDHAKKFHQYIGTIDCTPSNLLVSSTMGDLHKIMGVENEQVDSEIAKDIEDFIRDQKMEEALEKVKISNYLSIVKQNR